MTYILQGSWYGDNFLNGSTKALYVVAPVQYLEKGSRLKIG